MMIESYSRDLIDKELRVKAIVDSCQDLTSNMNQGFSRENVIANVDIVLNCWDQYERVVLHPVLAAIQWPLCQCTF